MEGGGDEVALAVVGGDGPSIDDGSRQAVQRFVAGGGVHESELPCTLSFALNFGNQNLTTILPPDHFLFVLQRRITHEHERSMLTGKIDSRRLQGLEPAREDGHRCHIFSGQAHLPMAECPQCAGHVCLKQAVGTFL